MYVDGLKIETMLAERYMSKKDYAACSGVSRQNISAIIRRGSCEPRTAGKLAAGLGVPVLEIVRKEAQRDE